MMVAWASKQKAVSSQKWHSMTPNLWTLTTSKTAVQKKLNCWALAHPWAHSIYLLAAWNAQQPVRWVIELGGVRRIGALPSRQKGMAVVNLAIVSMTIFACYMRAGIVTLRSGKENRRAAFIWQATWRKTTTSASKSRQVVSSAAGRTSLYCIQDALSTSQRATSSSMCPRRAMSRLKSKKREMSTLSWG